MKPWREVFMRASTCREKKKTTAVEVVSGVLCIVFCFHLGKQNLIQTKRRRVKNKYEVYIYIFVFVFVLSLLETVRQCTKHECSVFCPCL